MCAEGLAKCDSEETALFFVNSISKWEGCPKKINFYYCKGKDLNSLARCTILFNGKWIPIKEMPAKRFISGNVWKIRVTCDGYKEELFSLLIDWYQDEVIISANLHSIL